METENFLSKHLDLFDFDPQDLRRETDLLAGCQTVISPDNRGLPDFEPSPPLSPLPKNPLWSAKNAYSECRMLLHYCRQIPPALQWELNRSPFWIATMIGSKNVLI